VLFAALASLAAASLVSIALVTMQQVRMHELVAESLEGQGEVIAFSVAPTMTFDRPDEAAAALAALAGVDHLVTAFLFDAQGSLFAEKDRRTQGSLPVVHPGSAGLYRDGRWLIHHAPVTLSDEHLGTLSLVYDSRWMTARKWFDIWTALLITMLATTAAILVALRLQSTLARPVRELIRTSRAVSESGDYSVAARQFGDDELGELTRAFNAMLARVKMQTAEVAQANERFRVAIEGSSNGMIMVDESDRIVLVNAAVETIFGYRREELLGQPSRMLVPAGCGGTSAGLTPGQDKCGLRKDGSEFPLEITQHPIPTEHGLRVLNTVVDVTERKRSEAALRDREQRLTTLANAVPAFVWSTGADGEWAEFNDRWFDYTGMARGQLVDATTAGSLMHADDFPRIRALWEESAARSLPYEAELRIRRHDGEYRWFLVRAVPLRGEDGAVTGWFGTHTDIEDRKHAELERDALLKSERAARSEAEHASHMKDEFVATLSHELRTPLTAIVGWSQALRLHTADSKLIAEGLESIERNAWVQTRIIEDLLDMSRIVLGKMRLDVQLVELQEVVGAAIDSVSPAAGYKDIRLERVLDADIPRVHGDPSRLQQIAWNLVSNAVKFTPSGGHVQVALRRLNSHVELIVSDTGEGIPAEFLPRLFERFSQADSTTTRVHSGLGLGLSLVRHLTELHGGVVSASSPGKNQGATFTVTLPLAGAHRYNAGNYVAGSRPAGPRRALAVGGTPAELENVRVMIIEDQADARRLIERLLEGAQATVRTLDSAVLALEEVGSFLPDVIISDIGMPDMDGYEFIRELRRRPPAEGGQAPAIALTALARHEDRLRALRSGFQAHLCKPMDPAELLATVASLASPHRVRG
jgi:PAS domain S-box-containing protein